MKQHEFDEMLRQQFDNNEFEYNPNNWAQLSRKLDNNDNKRNTIAFVWWAPAIGIAASVALAFGFNKIAHFYTPFNSAPATAYQKPMPAATQPVAPTSAITSTHVKPANAEPTNPPIKPLTTNTTNKQAPQKTTTIESYATEGVAAIEPQATLSHTLDIQPKQDSNRIGLKPKLNKPFLTTHDFCQLKEKAPLPKFSLQLSGGLHYGAQTSGYSIAACAQRMISEKLYVEGDIAIVGSNNLQAIQYWESASSNGAPSLTKAHPAASSTTNLGAKYTETDKIMEDPNAGSVKTANVSFNLYYAQVTPTLGYRITKKFAVGAGPDFQQMLTDNRPLPSTVDRNTLVEVPTFDIGLVGKTEYSLSNHVKAAVFYRNGINNAFAHTNKYIERNYIQIQLKCSIFNKQ